MSETNHVIRETAGTSDVNQRAGVALVSLRVAIPVLVAGLLSGLLAPAAVATSYPTSWKTIFGHSTSCALGRGSVNDETHKSGATTVNRKGCNANNAAVGVPGGYLLAHTQLYRYSHGYVCSNLASKSNPDASPRTSSVTITSALVASAYCPSGGAYMGMSVHTRRSDSGGQYDIQIDTAIRTFQ